MYTVYWYIPCKYLFEGDSLSCGWRLQAKLMKEEFDMRCIGPSKAIDHVVFLYYNITKKITSL